MMKISRSIRSLQKKITWIAGTAVEGLLGHHSIMASTQVMMISLARARTKAKAPDR